MPIDTITFDVWNTLIVHEYYDDRLKIHRMKSIHSALNHRGYEVSWEQTARAYDYTEECLTTVWKNERDISNDSHLALFIEGLGMEADDSLTEIIREPYNHALLHFPPKMVDGARDLLASLSDSGYKIGLISNTGRTPGKVMRKVLDSHGVTPYFSTMIFSDETGYIKPNRRIFEKAIASIGSIPERTVHIGDHPLLDIYGARACNYKAILFTKYTANFTKYASRYYSANGRVSDPDFTVEELSGINDALASLNAEK
ncbi:MAG TPA: HAD family hydrolase [Methanocella sp.]|nr:HAD family hydrolase [Methanocella sp.]